MKFSGLHHSWFWLVLPLTIITAYLYIAHPPYNQQRVDRAICEDWGGLYLEAEISGGLFSGGGATANCIFKPNY